MTEKIHLKRAVLILTAVLSVLVLTAGPWAQVSSLKAYAADSPVRAVNTAYNGRSPYYIMVNRQMNTVTVYTTGDDGNYSVPVKAMVASCGRAGHETPLGTFITPDSRYKWRLMVDGSYGQYASRIRGSILFHSICYRSADKSKMISSEYDALGSAASLGCVRLQTADAKWIYDNCPAGTIVTIYDSSNPGALGKPSREVDSVSSAPAPYNTWDPTDPDDSNPWNSRVTVTANASASGTAEGSTKAFYGSDVTVRTEPASSGSDAPAFRGWYDGEGHLLSKEAAYTFKAYTDITLYAMYEGDSYGDVAADAWYAGSVSEAREKGLAYGITPVLFGADRPFTRAMAVQMIARATGADTSEARDSGFTDVSSSDWYCGAVNWAVENGVTNGANGSEFAPDASITRQDMLTMIGRYVASKSGSGPADDAAGSLTYSDTDQIADYAKPWVAYTRDCGILGGYEDNTVRPANVLNRAEGTVFIVRMKSQLDKMSGSEN